MNDRINYECYVVTPGDSIDLANSETVVSRHPHPKNPHALIVWTERKELKEVPLELLESTGDGDE